MQSINSYKTTGYWQRPTRYYPAKVSTFLDFDTRPKHQVIHHIIYIYDSYMYKTNGSGKGSWSPNERISVLIFGFPNPGKREIQYRATLWQGQPSSLLVSLAHGHIMAVFFQKLLYFYFYNTTQVWNINSLTPTGSRQRRITNCCCSRLCCSILREKFLKIFFNTCKRFQIIDQQRAFSCLNKSICSLEDSTLIKPTKGVLLRCTYCDTKQLLFSLLATQGPVGSLLVYITSTEFNTPF